MSRQVEDREYPLSSQDELLVVEVRGLMIDPTSQVPVVILFQKDSGLLLPIWIGLLEASAIALGLEGAVAPRPMTHDLLKSAFERFGVMVDRAVISSLRENTFFATLWGRAADSSVAEFDCRPSDAIALALRFDAPIYVTRSVLEAAKAIQITAGLHDEDLLTTSLDSLDSSDLGKYTM